MLPDFNETNRREKAIEYVKVDGIWEKNQNLIEAEKVAFLVKELLSKSPELEIGIVTFNARQQMCILEYLETFSIANNFLVPDTLIVKNIENIQGDEKDVIIFSTVYAPDSSGRLNMQFGSLNAQGGENRLNVAVTRAREKIYLVSSILPQQLHVEDTKNEGPKLLKKYLEYAHEVSQGIDKPYDQEDGKHGPNWYLKNRVLTNTLEHFEDVNISSSFPFVDLSIRSKDRYLGAVLTDDELYHQTISVKHAHVYKLFTLSEKKWPYTFVYSRQMWSHPDFVDERINRLIARNIEEG